MQSEDEEEQGKLLVKVWRRSEGGETNKREKEGERGEEQPKKESKKRRPQ